MDDAVRLGENLLTAMLEALDDAVIVTDRNACVRYVNRAALADCGEWTPGQSLAALLPALGLSAAAIDSDAHGAPRPGRYLVPLQRDRAQRRDAVLRVSALPEPHGGCVLVLHAEAPPAALREALEDSRRQLAVAYERGQIGFWEWNIEARTLTESGYWVGKTLATAGGAGMPDMTMPDTTMLDNTHADDVARVNAALRTHLKGHSEHYEVEQRVRSTRGGYIHFLVRGQAAEHNQQGRVTRMVGTYVDISALREQEAVLRFALESSRQGIWDWDVDRGILTEHGDREPRLAEYAINSPIDWPNLIEQLHPDDLETIDAQVRDHLRGLSDMMEMEIRLRRRSGGWGEFLVRGRALQRDKGGHVARVLGTYTEISERKAQERSLQLALENGRQGLWEWHPDSDRITLSREWYALFGHRPGSINSLSRELPAIFHPDDLELRQQTMLGVLDGRTDTFELEQRLRHADGHYLNVLARGRVMERGADGRALRVLGTHVDITDLQTARSQLLESRRLLETVIDAFPQRIFWKDVNNRYLGCNQLFANDAGAGAPNDLIGLHVNDLPWPQPMQPFLDDDRRIIDDHDGRVVTQHSFTPISGAPIWAETTKVPIHDRNGAVMGVLGIYDDISERRQREQEMTIVADAFTRSEKTRLLDALSEAAARLSGADYAFIARIDDDQQTTARVSASYPHHAGLQDWCYDIAPTPCASTLVDGHFFIGADVAAAYPDDREIRAWHIEAYAGQRLTTADGDSIGLFVLLFTTPQHDRARVRTVIDIFAARATVEMERERTHAILHASEQRLNAAIEGGAQGVWEWDANSDAISVLGQPFRDLEDRIDALSITHGTEFYELVHPADQAALRATLGAYFRGETQHYQLESRMRRPDGSYHWMLIRGRAASRDRDGQVLRMIGTLTDISAQKMIQTELETSQGFLELIVETVPQAIFWQDREFRYLGCNQRFAELARLATPQELIGRGDESLWWGTQTARFHEQDRALLAGVSARVQSEMEMALGNGERGWFDVIKVPMRSPDGDIIGILGAVHDISVLRTAKETAQRLALYDALTGLPNRRYFSERLDSAHAAAARRGLKCALLFIDMDQFKQINDTLGHTVGDALLQAVARRLQNVIREDDTVARLGGDEFVVLLPDIARDFTACAHQAQLVADKIQHTLGEPFQFEQHKFHVTPTIGISLFPEIGKNTGDVLKEADTAMYSGKAAGRNVTRFFRAEMEQATQQRLRLESDLRHAIERGQLELYFQPQVDRSADVTGAEVLLRWKHPDRGMIPPAEFIPVAEDCGLIVEIGHWVLETAFARLKAWMDDGKQIDELSINVSSRQFRADDFVGAVEQLLVAHRMPPHRVVFEITESTVVEDVAATIDIMDRLRRVGIRFAIDDFGVGYSSLSSLKRLPIDQLKIDRSFVADIGRDQSSEVICQTIIAMSQHLGLQTVAEGVETTMQFDFLSRLRCNGYQGHLFLPASAEREFLRYHEVRAHM